MSGTEHAYLLSGFKRGHAQLGDSLTPSDEVSIAEIEFV